MVIRASGLKRYYQVGGGMFARPKTLKAVDGVSFEIGAARTLAVVGESGCGKSTLARMVTLIEKPSAGELQLGARDALHPEPGTQAALRRSVQIVFQNPYGSLNPRKRIGAILEEPLIINSDLDKEARHDAALEMMRKVGLRRDHYDRYPHMFSGGQRQRIAIARALMLRPQLVVADEPVSALDVSIQAQVLNLLRDLQDEFRLSYLFISHDLGVVRYIADDVLVMYLGRTVEQGPKADIFAHPRHPYTRGLIASTPGVRAANGARGPRAALSGELPSPLDPPAGCAFSTRCPHATEFCHAQRPELRPFGAVMVACHHAEQIA